MTRRVPELHAAMPAALLYIHEKDAAKARPQAPATPRGRIPRGKIQVAVETAGRYKMPARLVYVPWFDESDPHQPRSTARPPTCPIFEGNRFQESAPSEVTKA